MKIDQHKVTALILCLIATEAFFQQYTWYENSFKLQGQNKKRKNSDSQEFFDKMGV